MRRIDGVAQHYAWGDKVAIPELLGVEPDGRPWAELWFGTHPAAPSTIRDDGELIDVSGPLPLLVKVLAAAEPLSLQAHPSAERAVEGHALGIYGDPTPKPELLCALTTFDALCGVRPPEATCELLRQIGADVLADRLAGDGIATVVEAIYRRRLDVGPTLAACAASEHPTAVLATALARRWPDDPSVAVTLLLNRVRLEPGEAIFLDAGNLHSYLGGVGIEVMAASDNVVRGGLTVKPIDVDELLTVFDPEPLFDPVMTASEVESGVHRYAPNGAPFVLWRVETTDRGTFGPVPNSGAIVICTDGADMTLPRGAGAYVAPGEQIELPAGSTCFIATTT
ncbi:MAG: mannose-6-phosphate isomerase, class I [Actinomycetota bacterium]|nr:mannose-6-phosphate isomerase, class I [Actinomycetota bacterium]